jgi:type IX secretion system PorP/SprF family membrane protein
MMRHFLKITLVVIGIINFKYSSAQDPHFSQISRIPAYYNPSAAGHGIEHVRLTMLYRNQWAGLPNAFKTQALFFDKQVSRVGLGANIVNNSTGESGIRQLMINGNISYRFDFGKHHLATGIQIGLLQKSFDPSKMTFDDQYVPDQGFNPANPTAETFSYTKTNRPDLGTGFLWTYGSAEKDNFLPYIGASVQHLIQPKETFIIDENKVPVKISFQVGTGIKLNDEIVLSPVAMYNQQQFAKELMVGSIVKLKMEDRNATEAGVFYRNKDAFTIYAGYQWNNFMTGISYDVNTSQLAGTRGALELTLTYIPKAKEKKAAPVKPKKETKGAIKLPLSKDSSMSQQTSAPSTQQKKTVPAVNKTKESKGAPTSITQPKEAKPISPIPKDKINTSTNKELVNATKSTESKSEATISLIAPRSIKLVELNLSNEVPTKAQVNISPLPDFKDEPREDITISEIKRKQISTSQEKVNEQEPNKAVVAAIEDTDGDGIPNSNDNCPTEVGTLSSKGCPELNELDFNDTTMIHFGNIEFPKNSSKMHGVYKLDVIEPALDSAWFNDNYTILLTGHADDNLSSSESEELSKVRADYVKSIFIKKGIKSTRIKTVAFGTTKPLVVDSSEEDPQTRNRRVEVYVIKSKK